MSTKTITLSEDAYEKLSVLKRVNESFSDVVRRIIPRKPLSSFAGILTEKEAENAKKIIQKSRQLSRERAKELFK